jgi:endoglucanase
MSVRSNPLRLASCLVMAIACSTPADETPKTASATTLLADASRNICTLRNKHCRDRVIDCGETGVDCGGGGCGPCVDVCANHCGNGKQDCGESGADCGGTCSACVDPCANHCGNGRQDCGEAGLDCGAECASCPTSEAPELPVLRGVSLAGAEFGDGALPGTYGTNYTYPRSYEVDHFMALGMNVFRLPFRWERLQRQQFAAFDSAELGRIDTFVNYATGRGAYVLLDPHNYARYYGAVIGAGVPTSAFADFWGKLAGRYKTNPRVIFGLMNEPNEMQTELWLADANAAIAAIRATGATNTIFVPGNAWSGAQSWMQNWYGTPNGVVMLGIDDPLDNFVIEVHTYLDSNASGSNMDACVSVSTAAQRLVVITDWLAQHGLRGFLGEFGAGENSVCLAAIDSLLDYLDAHAAQWQGWSYWAAGPWWGSSPGNIEPVNGVDKPQTGVLLEHIP